MQVNTYSVPTRKEAKALVAELEPQLWLECPGQFDIRIEAANGSAKAHGYIVKVIRR